MEKYTRQTAFNTAYLGLKAQGFEKSLDFQGACVYRGPNNTKCAIGQLFPDELYNQTMEGKGLNGIWEYGGIQELFSPDCDFTFLKDLQECHDGAIEEDKIEDYKKRYAEEADVLGSFGPLTVHEKLENFAFENNLTIPKEDSEQEETK